MAEKITAAENITNAAANTKKGNKPSSQSTYSIEELAGDEKELGADRIIIKTALKFAGKDSFTLAEAKEIVLKFKDKEVK